MANMLKKGLLLILVAPAIFLGGPAQGQLSIPSTFDKAQIERGERLYTEKSGCLACHEINGVGGIIGPELTGVGKRLTPSWIYSYIRDPQGTAGDVIMPNFGLSERDALELTAYLTNVPEGAQDPAQLKERRAKAAAAMREFKLGTPDVAAAGKALIANLNCSACHEMRGFPDPRLVGPELTRQGSRVKAAWLKEFLKQPKDIRPATEGRMPDFKLTEPELKAIAAYLMSLGNGANATVRPEITKGKELAVNLGCLSCHKIEGVKPAQVSVGPSLSFEGSRVKQEWLVSFLRNPKPIRPEGYIPGSFSRMPHFRMTDEEARAVAATLMTLKAAGLPEKLARPDPSIIQEGKKVLVRSGCVACHKVPGIKKEPGLGGFGGPELTKVGARLQPRFIAKWVADPASLETHPMMPTFNLSDREAEALAHYLLSLK